ncbi:PPE family protein [Mycobacterium avium subsp. hominissuis]|uniref:PPE family protein n=1 Tax=Mycobacterium avium TaxID=1764 RepID=UPI00293A3B35|nr:PPE family protein [Mycobacterium avium]MDV3247309.1 PPE family protein [Mycobacterium avium subsp. hominissuis]MDV3274841.1 PPE family protein [Mycobacterium avium subsp. hominissuis]MDV3322706.1 PPE family protein [Mycobacterium avium subsp. hominissuis]
MNFGLLPPEINSARMHTGPGPDSMISASETWNELAVRLHEIGAEYSLLTSRLAQARQDPTATAVGELMAAYVDWLNTVAAQAEQTALGARAAVDAFESALAAMVPPVEITANRGRRILLAATNCLGQHSAAIADTEADYQQMWAQNADAMYTYAAAAQAASTVSPFSSPPPAAAELVRDPVAGIPATGKWSMIAAPQIISAGHDVMPTIPQTLKALSLSPMTRFDNCLSSVASSLSRLGSLSAPSDFAINHLSSLHKTAALNTSAAILSTPTQTGGATRRSVAGLGRATRVGRLSVPQSWTTAASPSPVGWKAFDEAYSVSEPSDFIW